MKLLATLFAAPARRPGDVVLGGERRGLKIEGFDLGNSPAEYTSESVGGKDVVLTTTNGTKALSHARQSAQIYVGAFVNLSAVCAKLSESMHVDLLCAGTDGQITREDVLLAGAVVARLTEQPYWTPDDPALIARDAWLHVAGRVEGSALKARVAGALRQPRRPQPDRDRHGRRHRVCRRHRPLRHRAAILRGLGRDSLIVRYIYFLAAAPRAGYTSSFCLVMGRPAWRCRPRIGEGF